MVAELMKSARRLHDLHLFWYLSFSFKLIGETFIVYLEIVMVDGTHRASAG